MAKSGFLQSNQKHLTLIILCYFFKISCQVDVRILEEYETDIKEELTTNTGTESFTVVLETLFLMVEERLRAPMDVGTTRYLAVKVAFFIL